MKRPLQPLVPGVCFLVLACGVAAGQEAAPGDAKRELAALRATVEQLRAEVALLRRQVVQLELDRRRDAIRQIKAELETLRAERARLEDVDQARRQDLRDIEDLLVRGDLTDDDRSGMEAARAELAVEREREIDQQSEAVRGRESELLRRLETEEASTKRLEEAWKLSGGNTQ
jgi:hypothetical protein